MVDPSSGAPSRSSSRVRAPQVAPVDHEGVRYAPMRAASAEGLPAGIYVTATRIDGGQRLWTTRVWETSYDSRREADVQNVFLRKLELDTAGQRLLVEDERGRKAALTLDSGAVSPR